MKVIRLFIRISKKIFSDSFFYTQILVCVAGAGSSFLYDVFFKGKPAPALEVIIPVFLVCAFVMWLIQFLIVLVVYLIKGEKVLLIKSQDC